MFATCGLRLRTTRQAVYAARKRENAERPTFWRVSVKRGCPGGLGKKRLSTVGPDESPYAAAVLGRS